MYTLYRRHEKACRFRKNGIRTIKCNCPIWIDGTDDSGTRRRVSLKTRNWPQAQIRLLALERGELPLPAPASSMLLSAAIASFLDDAGARRLQPSTIVSYRNTLAHLTAFFPDNQTMAQVNLAELTRFRSSRAITAASSCKEIQTMRAFFHFGAARKWITENPATGLKTPAVDRLPTMPFAPEEVTAILRACDRIDNSNAREIPRARLRARALVLTLLYSGFRISDAVKLRRTDLNMSTGQLLVRMMKTRAPLYLRLPPVALAALAAVPPESLFFFWSGKSKLSTAIGSARRTIDCVLELAGVPDGHPHRFRDTFSVSLLQNGTDLRTVQLLLGHASIRTTEKHYAPFVTSMQRILDEAVSTLHFAALGDTHPLVNPQQDALRNAQRDVLPFPRPKRA